MNDEFVLKQAQLFANRVEEAAHGDRAGGGRPGLPDGAEPSAGCARRSSSRSISCKTRKLVDLTDVLFNLNEFLYVR